MLGGWQAASPFYKIIGGIEMSAEERIQIVRELLKVFTPEDREKILEIMRHILEAAHSPLSI